MWFGAWWADDFYMYRAWIKDYVWSVSRWVYHLIVAVYENNSRKLYLDGKLFFSDTNNVPRTLWVLEVGRWNFPSITYMPWSIANPFVYTKALSQTEIQELYYSTYIQ